MLKQKWNKRALSAVLTVIVAVSMIFAMPIASNADVPPGYESDVGLYTNGLTHVKDIGDPTYKYVDETSAALNPDVPYTADSMFGSIFEKDKAAGGTDYYLDRVLGVSGSLGLTILQTRGRSLYSRGASGNNWNTMGFRGTMYAGGGTSIGSDLYQITLATGNTAEGVTEISADRFNAPSHAKVSFDIGSTGVRADTKKFITYDNVAVTTVKLTNSGSGAKTFTARAASNIATAPMEGAENVLVGTRNLQNNANNGLTQTTWSVATVGVQAKGFTINGTRLEKAVTVPAGESVEFSVVAALWTDDLPQSRTEFDRYAELSPADAFKDGVTAFNERWAKDIPYINVPDPAVEKAILYRWWGERYNSLDTNESGYAYQFPTTVEGANLYQNSVVLTQPMHLQDTKWMRTPYLSYGQILNVGELSGSSAFHDSPGHGSWNNHYSQYIGTAGLETYAVHGGGTDIAKKFAYYFEKDGVGQLEHYDGNGNNLIAYDTNYMPGNDADALTFGYPKANTGNGGRNIERPESAYVWGDFDAAAKLYAAAGASGEKVNAMNDKADEIKDAILKLLWDPEEKMFLAKTTRDATAVGPSTRPNHLTDKTHIPVRESNLYDVYAQNLIDPADAGDYVDGFRFLTYGDNFPIFPFYTANQYDKSIVTGGSNNFSNINFTVQYRAVRSALRYYDPEEKWLDEEYAKQLLDWMAWSIYPNAGDLRVPSQAEFYSNWNAATKAYSRNNHVHVMLGNMNYIYVEDMGGIQPRLDDKIELWPIDLGYDYFMVNNLRYHGKDLTIVWDKDGTKYGLGAGYSLFMDGEKMVTTDKLGKFTYDPNANTVNAEAGLTVTYKAGTGTTFANAVNTAISDTRVVDYLKKAGLEAGVGQNIAAGATATASFTQEGARTAAWRVFHTPGRTGQMNWDPGSISELERPVAVGAVNDGVTVNEPYWGNYGTTNARDWVELDFGAAKTLDNVQVYFYNDGQSGGYVPPMNVGVQIPDAGGGWKFIDGQMRDYKTVKAKRNDIVFEPVTTDKIRVAVVNKPGSYTAITEIQAFSSGKDLYDMTNTAPSVTLSRNTNKDGNLTTELAATVSDDGLPIGAMYAYNWSLVSAPTDANARIVTADKVSTMVLGDKEGSYTFKFTASDGALSTEKEIVVALAKKNTAMDFGPYATITNTGSASWENPAMVNNASTPASSNPGSGNGWGTWGTSRPGTSQANPAQLTYTWDAAIDLTRTDIYWYDDGGGTRAPRANTYKIEYSPDGTEWIDVPLKDTNAYANGIALSRYNPFEFANTIKAKALRVSIWGLQGSGAGTGILRWRAYGLGVESVEEPVYTRVIEGELPKLPETLNVTYSDGTKGVQPFTWSEVTPDMVATMNVDPFSVFGQNSAYNLFAETKVYVRPDMGPAGITVSNVENSGEFTTPFGQMPDLPKKAVVAYNDGSRDSISHDITWEIDPAILYAPGTHTVYGSVSVPSRVGPTSAKAAATLTVEGIPEEDFMLALLADMMDTALNEDQSKYTPASVKALNDAVEAAQAVFEDRDAYSDEDIMDLMIAIADAIEGLEYKAVKDHLQDIVTQAKAVDTSKLITDVKENLLDKIADAEDILLDDDATQDDIDAAYLALVEAMVETGQVKGDNWAKLESLVNLVKGYKEATYTSATYAPFKAAIDKAQTMIAAKDNYTQTKVDAAYDTLYAAWRDLARAANFSALQSVVDAAQAIIDNIDDYVPASVAGLAEALGDAKAVLGNNSSTQAQVDAAARALTVKIALVRIKEDKSKLSSTLKSAKSIKTAGYTASSVATLTAALNYGETILDAKAGAYTQIQVDTATEKIGVAVMSLVKSSALKADSDKKDTKTAKDTAAAKAKDKKQDVSIKTPASGTAQSNSGGSGGDIEIASKPASGIDDAANPATASDDTATVASGDAAALPAQSGMTEIASTDTPLAQSGSDATAAARPVDKPEGAGGNGMMYLILAALVVIALVTLRRVLVIRKAKQTK